MGPTQFRVEHDEVPMTPRQARIAFAGFAVLAAAVTYNALYRQDALPADRGAARAAPETRSPVAKKDRAEKLSPAPGKVKSPADPAKRGALGPTKASEAAAPAETASADTIRAIQRELKRRGHGALEADGATGPATRAAILSFEEANHLPLTGQPTDELLKQLLLGVPSPAAARTTETRSTHADARIR
jgi:hypothetical protein